MNGKIKVEVISVKNTGLSIFL
jgi:hypothetical protein